MEEPELLCVWTLAPEVARAGSTLLSEFLRPGKMLLDLSEEHKEHLAFLPQVDSTGQGARPRRVDSVVWGRGSRGVPGAYGLLASLVVVAEFGRIAVEFLRRGSNPKVYEGAASKTGRGTSRGNAVHSLAPWRGSGEEGVFVAPRVLFSLW